jgi:hypothetical protein
LKLITFLKELGMSEITGIVKEIFEGQVASGRNAGDPFWSITLEESPDSKITCFAEEEKKGWIEGLEQNREYTFTVKVSKDEKYINIAGQTVPCVDQGGDMRDDTGEYADEDEVPDHVKASCPIEMNPPKKKPVPIATRRKPPVTTSTAGSERVFKNRISALNAAIEYITATDPTVPESDLMECADRFYKWISE